MSYLGIFLVLVGIILTAIGAVLLVVHRERNEPRPWWMWGLLIGGIILVLIGLALWIFSRPTTHVAITSGSPAATHEVRHVETYHEG